MPHRSMLPRAAARLCAAALLLCSVTVSADDQLVLVGGDTIHGRIVAQTAESVIFQHAVLGHMVIDRSSIESIIVEDQQQSPQTKGEDEAQAADAGAGAPTTSDTETESSVEASAVPLIAWKSRFEAGFNGSHGRTEQLDGRATFATQRRTDAMRFAFDANYRTATSRGDRTQNKFDAGAINDWLFPDSPWLAFVQGRFEYDEFAAYDQRYSAGGGAGYTFIKDDRTELVGRVGLGGSTEQGGPNDGAFTPEGVFKLDLTHHLTDLTRITAGAEYNPDLSQFGDYRAVLAAAIETKLSPTSPASLKFGVRQELDEYRNSTQEDLLEFFGLFVVEF